MSDDEDDPDLDDGVPNDDDVPYLPDSVPWVQRVKDLLKTTHPQNLVIKVLGPMHFDELGFSNSDELNRFMNPSERAGSLQRYVVRAQAEAKLYFMVKEIKSPNGEAEITIGRILRAQSPSVNMIPAIGGFKAVGTNIPLADFVVLPFVRNTAPLDVFIRDKYPERLNLGTTQILAALHPVLKAMYEAFQTTRFLHLDCKSNQFLVTRNLPLTIYLVDYGHSAISAIENGARVIVNPCSSATGSTKTFQEEFSQAATTLHELIAASSPAKDAALIRQWNGERRRQRNLVIPIPNFLGWLAGHCNPSAPAAPLPPPNTTSSTQP